MINIALRIILRLNEFDFWTFLNRQKIFQIMSECVEMWPDGKKIKTA